MLKVFLTGNTGSEPEMRYLPEGLVLCNVSVGVGVWNKGQESTVWVRVTFFGKTAERASKLEKGTRITVLGKITNSPRVYQDRKGEHRTSLDVVGDEFEYSNNKSAASANGKAAEIVDSSGWNPDEEIPF